MIMLSRDSPTEFEFDEAKSRLNKRKHGIDFVEAQALWLDPDYREGRAREDGEARWIVIGAIRGRLWSAIITYRDGRVRIISVRRARAEEEARYEEKDQH